LPISPAFEVIVPVNEPLVAVILPVKSTFLAFKVPIALIVVVLMLVFLFLIGNILFDYFRKRKFYNDLIEVETPKTRRYKKYLTSCNYFYYFTNRTCSISCYKIKK